jgi:DNA-binding response OmpR family regulator
MLNEPLSPTTVVEIRTRVAEELGDDLVHIVELAPDLEEGLETIRSLRRARPQAVIAAIGGAEPIAAIVALEEGADVHLPATARVSHIVAQLRAILRRAGRREPRPVARGGLIVDTGRREATFEGARIPFTPYEFRVFAYLAERVNQVTSNEELVAAMHGSDARPAARRDMKIWIRRLRLKLEDANVRGIRIETVRGFGYMLVIEAAEEAAATTLSQ